MKLIFLGRILISGNNNLISDKYNVELIWAKRKYYVYFKKKIGCTEKNITSIPWKIKNNISLSSILQESTIGVNVKIHPKVKFYRSRLGDFSYVGPNSYVADTEIGKFTSISQDCYIGGAAHPLHWTGSSLHFYCTNPNEEGVSGSGIRKTYFESFKKTRIGSDVWIGARVLVLA